MTDAIDVAAVRRDFPLLQQEGLVYLDSGATSQKPQQVIDREIEFLTRNNAAVHRGAHTLAAEATELFEDARETVAGFVGASADQLIWTSGATNAINLAAYSLSNASIEGGPLALKPGDEIVVTEAEHHANLVPWIELAKRTGATLRHLPLNDDGTLDLTGDVINERTKVVAFTHASNVLGIVNPVDEIVARAKAVGALTVMDACQSAPHLALDLPALGVDLAAFSGHKMLAPYGIGALYGRADVLDALPPFQTGGSMIETVTMDSATFMPAPQKFEAGTQPVSQAVAFAEAVRYLDAVGMENIAAHEAKLEKRMRDGLREIPGIRLFGDADAERVPLWSFDVDGVHAHDAGQYLDSKGVAVRVGHHCAQPLHRRFGATASVRASAALYNTEEDIETMLDAVAGIRPFFGAGS